LSGVSETNMSRCSDSRNKITDVISWGLPACRLFYLIKFLISFLIFVKGSIGFAQSKEMSPSSQAVRLQCEIKNWEPGTYMLWYRGACDRPGPWTSQPRCNSPYSNSKY